MSKETTVLFTVPLYVLKTRKAEIETKNGWVPAFVNKILPKEDGTVTLTCSAGGVIRDYPYPGTKLRPYTHERWNGRPRSNPNGF